MAEFNKLRILKQLKLDEGFRAKAYWDIKQYTNGYGTRAKHKDEVITKEVALIRLDGYVAEAERGFDKLFKGHEQKFNEVRTEALMNMVYNMGIGSVMGFRNTLACIRNTEQVDWNKVADNLEQSKWRRQVGDRATRIIKEVRTGIKEEV